MFRAIGRWFRSIFYLITGKVVNIEIATAIFHDLRDHSLAFLYRVLCHLTLYGCSREKRIRQAESREVLEPGAVVITRPVV